MKRKSQRWLDELQAETVVVHLKSGTFSFRAIVAAVYADSVVLRSAVVLDQGDQTALDGDIAVPRENVDFFQVLGGS